MRVGCKVPASFHLARLAEGKVILNCFWDYPHPITSLGIIVFKTLPFLITGGKDVILGNYGPAWRFYRKLFVTALRQYLSDPPLIESRVSTQAEKLVQFMEEQDGKPFDPADCLMHGVADVICGIAFKDGSDTANPDLNKFVKLFSKYVANANDNTAVAILDFFSWARYLPIKAYDRALQPFFEMHDIIRKLLRERKRILIQQNQWKILCRGSFAPNMTSRENVRETKQRERLSFLKTILLCPSEIWLLPATKPRAPH